MHGCAFNVNTDLSYFSMIVPCGLEGVMITSLKDILGEEIDFGAVSARSSAISARSSKPR